MHRNIQYKFSKATPWNGYANQFGEKDLEVRKTLEPVDREDANLEAEHGEKVVTDLDGSGLPSMYNIGGKRHYAGGTPLNLPSNSFIFSRDKSMEIRNPEILEQFGIAAKKKMVPADIAKKYDINNYRKVLADPNSDNLSRNTAEMMITNYNKKLAKLALAQESIKGFPDGIPTIAMPYLSTSGLDMSQLFQQAENDTDNDEQPQARYGMNYIPEMYWQKMQYGGVPQFKKGGQTPQNNRGQVTIQYSENFPKQPFAGKKEGGEQKKKVRVTPPGKFRVEITPPKQFATGGIQDSDVTPYKGRKGEKTPTGQNPGTTRTEEDFAKLYGNAGIDISKLDDAGAQAALYDKSDPYARAYMWGSFGDTAAGKSKSPYEKWSPLRDKSGQISESFDEYKKRLKDQYGSDEKLKAELDPLKGAFADSKSGRRTAFLLHTFDKPEQAKDVVNTLNSTQKDTGKQKDVPQGNVDGYNEQTPANFWLQDIIKTAGAARDMYGIHKYLPWQGTYNPYIPSTVYYDPTRELAANAETANLAAQTAGTFGSPQQLSARLSQIQGQAAENAANIMGRYNNLNVGAANQYEMNKANILNEAGMRKADLATQLYDKTTIANQQFDNAKAAARAGVRQSLLDALTNRAQTQALNSMQKQYRVDPLTGGLTYFAKNRDITGEKSDEDLFYKKLEEGARRLQGLGITGSDLLKYYSGK